jgi:hypothetical protein
MNPDYLTLLRAEDHMGVRRPHVMRDVDVTHPDVRRHNERVVWTIGAALEVTDTKDEVMDAQADLQTALGALRLEMSREVGTPESIRARLALVEDRMAAALARLHVALMVEGTTMFSPAQHPDVTGRDK